MHSFVSGHSRLGLSCMCRLQKCLRLLQSHFFGSFYRQRMVIKGQVFACISLLAILAPCDNAFAVKKIVSLKCENTTVKECLSVLEQEGQVTVSVPEAVFLKRLTVTLKNAYLFEALTKVLDAAKIENFTIAFDEANSTILVDIIGFEKTVTNDSGKKNTPRNDSSIEGESKAGSGRYATPGPNEMKAVARQSLDLDAEFELPGGQKTSLRRMKAAQEKADLYEPPRGALVLPQEGSPTFQQLQDIIASGEKDHLKDLDITLPDGKVVNSRVLREKSKSESPAASPENTSSPQGEAQ